MPIKYKRADVDGNIRALARASSEFRGMIAEEMENIAPAIKDSMQFHSDLHKQRISENMVNAMESEVSRTGLQLRFGFLTKLQDYFQYQTVTGFTHWSSGKFIQPSLALSDAKEDAELLMQEGARRVRRNFMARLRRRG